MNRRFTEGGSPKVNGRFNSSIRPTRSRNIHLTNVTSNFVVNTGHGSRNNSHFISENQIIDVEVDCSLAYSFYLQIVAECDMVEKAVETYTILLDDQLTIQNDLFLKQVNEQKRLLHITTNGSVKDVVGLIKELKMDCKEFLDLSTVTKLNDYVFHYSDIVRSISCRLYLKNIRLFNVDNIDSILVSLKRCKETAFGLISLISYQSNDLKKFELVLNQVKDMYQNVSKNHVLLSKMFLKLTTLLIHNSFKKYSDIRLNSV